MEYGYFSDVRNRDDTVDIEAYDVRMTIVGESVNHYLLIDLVLTLCLARNMMYFGSEKCAGMTRTS